MKRNILLYALAVMTALACLPDTILAAPARKCLITYTQPDGSTFRGYVRGDEFCHFRTTESGRIIARDADGWWCYASYDETGNLNVSGTHVSAANAAASTFSIGSGRQFYPKASERRRMFNETVARKTMMKDFLTQGGTATKSGAAAKPKHGIIILAAFKDVPFKYSREYFVNMLTKNGYSYNGATGSALDYFNDQFGGLVDFRFDVSEVVTLPENRKYYGGNNGKGDDKNPEQMIIDACKLASENGTDFSKYDDDNDGYVDNVFVFFSGGDEADGSGEDCIWSHAYYIESGAGKSLTLNGKRIDSYACTSELTPEVVEYGGGYAVTGKYVLAGIGTFCHEYSHTFGLPDLYDTDYELSGGQAEALWRSTGLMDGGNMNNNGNTPPNYNAIDRECLGLGEPVMLTDGSHEIEPIDRDGTYYRIDTGIPDEYFLLECRDNKAWDRHIGGKGLLVYHIDKSGNQAGKSDNYGKMLTAAERWNYYNEVNCRPDRQCADLIEADPNVVGQARSKGGSFSPDDSQIAAIFFPSGNHSTLNSTNGLACWNTKENCSAELREIKILGNGNVSLTASGVGTVIVTDIFQTAAILDIYSDKEAREVKVKCDGREFSAANYEKGKYSVFIDGLKPETGYTATVTVSEPEAPGEVRGISFTTEKRNGTIPRIAFSKRGRNINGSFNEGARIPLLLNNVIEDAPVTWYFDGKEIEVDSSNYFHVRKDGLLKAVIHSRDGSETVIRKSIVLR